MSDSKSTLITETRLQDSAAIVTVQGEIDLHNSPELRKEILRILAAGNIQKLILDLAGVAYMDSSAIAVMVEALQKLRKTDGKVYLSQLQPRVKGLLEIARLDTIFVVTKDVAEALAK